VNRKKRPAVAQLIKLNAPHQRANSAYVYANPLADGSTSYTIRFRNPPHVYTRRDPKQLVAYANRLGYHFLWSSIPGVECDTTFIWLTEEL
jgi:hypothetical protein